MSELSIPKHVGIIMDGNRRWAKERGLSSLKGHQAGAKNLRRLAVHILGSGIKTLSVFAFSNENFKRSSDEVKYLMDLFVKEFRKEYKIFKEKKIKVVFSGRKENLRKDVLDTINELSIATKDFTNGTLNICLNYGGQQEIIDVTKKMIMNNINPEEIDEELFSEYMYNSLEPIDLLIRTSGEIRVSNFMLWQMAYAEMYFPLVHFPDFNENEFDKALREFTNRERRFGGNKQ